ncbi:MAG: Ni/Fe hydrogenase subunit alpha [Deltaproteobacteria bacterium]|nr:Ni/Fe hydrogenase subunit alpha [Deltaproteobacteria bacterium]
MSRSIRIDPVTRLEGAGRIEIHLDGSGNVDRARFQVVDFKGFETFCRGRAAEEMPTLTQKICGVCPTAHHLASVKALDRVFAVKPPPAARRIRDLAYHGFLLEDHLLHFLVLAGPDFLSHAGERSLMGVLKGPAGRVARRLLQIRERVRGLAALTSGSALYPVFGVPGGVTRPLRVEDVTRIRTVSEEAVSGAQEALELFHDRVLTHPLFTEMLEAPHLAHRTHYMGLVDDRGVLSVTGGRVRVVGPEGVVYREFDPEAYPTHLEERVVSWSYMKPVFLKAVGWQGYTDGPQSGVYRVGPLARLNACEALSTPLAQAEAERMFSRLGGRPVHQTMAYHWARLIEALFAAERMREIAEEGDLADPCVRRFPTRSAGEGTGVCEAPRGTLFHQYRVGVDGLLEDVDLVVATQHNAAAVCMAVEAEARAAVGSQGALTVEGANRVEVAFRAYDPCLACASHAVEGVEGASDRMRVYDRRGDPLRVD